jgi:hypothetical protein
MTVVTAIGILSYVFLVGRVERVSDYEDRSIASP